MSEADKGGAMSPAELVEVFAGPMSNIDTELSEAVLNRDAAAGVHLMAQEVEQRTASELVEAGAALEQVERRRQLLANAGRAGLSEITDYPPKDTLRADMWFGGSTAEAIDELFAKLDALERYGEAEGSLVAVVTSGRPMHGSGVNGRIQFLRPSPLPEDQRGGMNSAGQAEMAEAAETGHGLTSWIERRNRRQTVGHYLAISTASTHNLRLTPAREFEEDDLLAENFQTVEHVPGPVGEAVFAGTADEVRAAFEDKVDLAALLTEVPAEQQPSLVVFGDEAIRELVRVIAGGNEQLRPALFGAMLDLDKPYDGPGVSDIEVREQEQAKFTRRAYIYAMEAADHRHEVPEESGRRMDYSLFTPNMQQFLGIPDERIVGEVKAVLKDRVRVEADDIGIEIEYGEKGIDVPNAWDTIWRRLHNRGFNRLASEQSDPVLTDRAVLNIQIGALEDHLLHNPRMKRSERREVNRLLEMYRGQLLERLED